MPKFQEIKKLNYKVQEIFDLVMDIEKYPEFLPWCKKAQIIAFNSENNLQADLLINFKGFMEKYRSDVSFFQDEYKNYIVESIAIQGPFKKLFSKWKISKIDENSCEVEFEIEFEFNSFILQKMIGLIFENATKKMMNSFENRAFELYS